MACSNDLETLSLLRSITEATSRYEGLEFFQRFVQQIAVSFDVAYALIAIPEGSNPGVVRTLAFWSHGELAENVTYSLSGTPCANVMNRSVCFFGDSVQQMFPEDEILQALNIHSYLGTPLTNRDGEVLGVLSICDVDPMDDRPEIRDLIALLAERAALEVSRWSDQESRRESESLLRLMTERWPAAHWTTDRDLRITHIYGGALQTVGMENQQFVGMSVHDVFGAENKHATPVREHLRAIDGEEVSYEDRFGGRWFQARVEPLHDRHGKLTGVIGVAFDITELKQAQQSLEASELRFRRLVEHAPEAVMLLDVETGKFVMANRAAERLFKYSAKEMRRLGPKDISAAVQSDGRPSTEHIPNLIAKAIAGESLQFEWTKRDSEGRLFPAEVSLLRLEDDGKLLIRGSVTDVSEKRQAERTLRLREAELAHVARMSTMGEMVGGLAHELNQPLYAIQNYAKACETVLGTGDAFDRDQLCEWMGNISSTAQFAGGVLNRLRDFVKETPIQRRPVALGHIIDTARMLTQFDARQYGVRFDVACTESLPLVNVDEVQIQQIFVNLIRNAFDAIDVQKEVVPHIRIDVKQVQDFIEVEVGDNGRGLPAEKIPIFDAFTSTKKGGMGLGLAIAKTIAEAHGGTLTAEHQLGGGAVFRFTLPIAADET